MRRNTDAYDQERLCVYRDRIAGIIGRLSPEVRKRALSRRAAGFCKEEAIFGELFSAVSLLIFARKYFFNISFDIARRRRVPVPFAYGPHSWSKHLYL